MKRLLIILFVLIATGTYGQGIIKQFGNGYKNVNGFQYGWFNGADTIAYFKATGLLMKKPVLLNVWTTAGRPASPVPGMFGFNSDSATIEWYSSDWFRPGAGGGGGTTYTFSTGLTNSSGTVTANVSTGVSGGQTIIGSTSTNSGLTLKTTTGVGTTGADYIFTGGNNGATEFMRILNSGNVGIGTNAPAVKFVVTNGNSRLGCHDGSDEYGYISTSVASGRLQLNFTRILSSGEDRINFAGGSYIMSDVSASGELRLFNPFGGTFTTLYGNGSEQIRLSSAGVTLGSLAGSGDRMVVANASGVLGTQAIPSGGITSINSETGPGITISSGTATSIGTSTNTVTVNVTPSSAALPHTLDAVFTTAGNSGTGETDLYSYSVPANKLAVDGRTVNFEIDGEFNDNTATATIKLYFAGNVTLNTGAVNISTLTAWRIKGYIIRTSSTTAHVTYEIHCPGLATPVFLGYNNLTSLDFTVGNIFKVTAQAGGAGGGTDDITAHSWQLLYKPQPQ